MSWFAREASSGRRRGPCKNQRGELNGGEDSTEYSERNRLDVWPSKVEAEEDSKTVCCLSDSDVSRLGETRSLIYCQVTKASAPTGRDFAT